MKRIPKPAFDDRVTRRCMYGIGEDLTCVRPHDHDGEHYAVKVTDKNEEHWFVGD